MEIRNSIDIDAAAADVWAVMTDVERWPEWTPSVSEVQRSDHGPLQVGERVRVKQPGFPAAVWEVTDLEPERAFWWTAKTPGLVTDAGHLLESKPGGPVTVTLIVRQRGPLAGLLALLAGRRSRRFVQQEADGLKRRCEGG